MVPWPMRWRRSRGVGAVARHGDTLLLSVDLVAEVGCNLYVEMSGSQSGVESLITR